MPGGCAACVAETAGAAGKSNPGGAAEDGNKSGLSAEVFSTEGGRTPPGAPR